MWRLVGARGKCKSPGEETEVDGGELGKQIKGACNAQYPPLSYSVSVPPNVRRVINSSMAYFSAFFGAFLSFNFSLIRENFCARLRATRAKSAKEIWPRETRTIFLGFSFASR